MTKEKEFSLFPCIPLENFQCHRFLKKKKGTVMCTNCAALIGMWFLWVPVTEHEETDEGGGRNKREREANFIQQHRKGKPLTGELTQHGPDVSTIFPARGLQQWEHLTFYVQLSRIEHLDALYGTSARRAGDLNAPIADNLVALFIHFKNKDDNLKKKENSGSYGAAVDMKTAAA
jgi:hypothetical protein